MQILTAGNMPKIKIGIRTVKENLVIFEQEVSNLPKCIYDKYANLANIVDKLHKANAEEEAAKRKLDDYINNLEDTHGPLTKKVQEVDQRNSIFEELAIEADKIRAHGNIIAYEKQAKEKIPTTLTEDQIDKINNELEK